LCCVNIDGFFDRDVDVQILEVKGNLIMFVVNLKLTRSLARFVEFKVIKWLSRNRRFLRIPLSFLAVLYEGAFLLLITGRMEMPGLCNFSSAFSGGGDGFFFV